MILCPPGSHADSTNGLMKFSWKVKKTVEMVEKWKKSGKSGNYTFPK